MPFIFYHVPLSPTLAVSFTHTHTHTHTHTTHTHTDAHKYRMNTRTGLTENATEPPILLLGLLSVIQHALSVSDAPPVCVSVWACVLICCYERVCWSVHVCYVFVIYFLAPAL